MFVYLRYNSKTKHLEESSSVRPSVRLSVSLPVPLSENTDLSTVSNQLSTNSDSGRGKYGRIGNYYRLVGL